MNYCITYEVEAENEEDAIKEANELFSGDLPILHVKDFGCHVEEANECG